MQGGGHELEGIAALTEAGFETAKIHGSSVGKVFEACVKSNAVDLLVMGAYRHSRLNEIV
jgi:nucleotide-binding universal stress UspA family protein